MAIINQATKELQVKIVYYGPALGGKTTNLVQVHEHVQTQEGHKGKLVSLATSSDRTLFFDFLPIEAMAIKGFKTKFQLYTVPGQVIYNTTRQLVLRGVDGIVFVADSQYEKMEENVKSVPEPRGEPARRSTWTSTTFPTCCSTTSATCRTSAPIGIHGVSPEQSRRAGARLRRHCAQVRGCFRNAEHDHTHVAA